MAKTPLLTIRVDDATRDRWAGAARDDGQNLSNFIRSCVEERIADDKVHGPGRVGSLDPSLVSAGASKAPAKKTKKAPAACARERFHRPGTFCKSCGTTQ